LRLYHSEKRVQTWFKKKPQPKGSGFWDKTIPGSEGDKPMIYRKTRIASGFSFRFHSLEFSLLPAKPSIIFLNRSEYHMPKSKNENVMRNIEKLVEEEHDLFNRKDLSDKDRARLEQVQVQLDQCWDLLRQRRALAEFGKDPEEAHVRPAKVVEDYEN
jgi:hypothetical protein